ncbi:MAG: M20 family metallo-hydrolase [Deltaproteobacteria bacterium]|nr:M20 family metallo-hydrolase [Deltaproteobacteria bacterium]
MSDLPALFKRIDGYKTEVIELQRELTSRVALGPLNGGTGEHSKTQFIKDLFTRLNPSFMEEVRTPDDGAQDGYRPNLIAKWNGRQAQPVVWVLSHSDVVPPGDLSLWNSDPFAVKVEDDRVIGRGVEDNQHGFVSSYLALKAILSSAQELARTVGLIIVADEETGSRHGLEYLLKERRDCFRDEDLIIVPDAGNDSGTMIEVAEKSMLWLKFTVTGHQCHASTPQKGKNSLLGAAELITALGKLQERFNESDPLFSPHCSTFAPTKMEANVPNINTIPGKDVFYMDCRVLSQYGLDDVILAAEGIARDIGSTSGLKIAVEVVHRQDAAEPTSPQAPVVRALQDAILRVNGKKASPMGIGGGTVAAIFRNAGLPAAVWCTAPDTAHQPNEYCLISDIISDAKVFAAVYQG